MERKATSRSSTDPRLHPADPAGRLLSLPPFAIDIVLGVGLGLLAVVETWAGPLPPDTDPILHLLPTALALAAAVPLLFRSRYPLAVMVASNLALAGSEMSGSLDLASTWVSAFIAAFSAGLAGGERRSAKAAFAVLAGAVTAIWLLGLSRGTAQPWDLLLIGITFALWFAGDVIRTRTERARVLEQQAARLEVERDMEAIRAATEERARIARELHDVIAHSLSVMVIQASAAKRILDDQPEQARLSMQAVEETGRAAMTEMRRLLGIVRHEEGAPLTDPQPSIERLDPLVAELREAGLPVTVRVEGRVRPLPAGVDVSAYRIVQEALTNVLRHAGAAPAAVTIRYLRDSVEVEVVDDGGSRPAGALGDGGRVGHGLVGMRERVALLEGDLEVGARPGGGFGVRARLPIEAAAGHGR